MPDEVKINRYASCFTSIVGESRYLLILEDKYLPIDWEKCLIECCGLKVFLVLDRFTCKHQIENLTGLKGNISSLFHIFRYLLNKGLSNILN